MESWLFAKPILAALIFLAMLLAFSSCSYTRALSAEKFLARVIEIQAESDSSLLNLSDDLAELAGETEKVPAAVERIAEQRRAIEKAREQIAALEPPAEAIPLQEDILQLYDEGAALLLELEASGRYRLEVEPVTTAYEAASKQFSGSVAAAAEVQGLLATIKQYESAAAGTASRLQNINPPLLYKRSHERLVSNLKLLGSGLSEMATGLEREDAAAVEAASSKLAEISAGNEQMASQMLADRETDYKEFNARIAEMNRLMEKIRKDQQELRTKFERS